MTPTISGYSHWGLTEANIIRRETVRPCQPSHREPHHHQGSSLAMKTEPESDRAHLDPIIYIKEISRYTCNPYITTCGGKQQNLICGWLYRKIDLIHSAKCILMKKWYREKILLIKRDRRNWSIHHNVWIVPKFKQAVKNTKKSICGFNETIRLLNTDWRYLMMLRNYIYLKCGNDIVVMLRKSSLYILDTLMYL